MVLIMLMIGDSPGVDVEVSDSVGHLPADESLGQPGRVVPGVGQPGVDTETPGGDCGDLVPPLVGNTEDVSWLQSHRVTQGSTQLVQHWLGVSLQVLEVDQAEDAALLVGDPAGPEFVRVRWREESPDLAAGQLTDEVLPVGVLVAGRDGPLRPRPQCALRALGAGVTQPLPAKQTWRDNQGKHPAESSSHFTELLLTDDLVHVLVVQVSPPLVTEQLPAGLWREEL